jgi:succinyl-diaminopimelate desuccinylase
MPPLADRLAARTLELVDIRSESRHEAQIAAHVVSLVPPSFAPEYAGDDAFVFATPRREDRELVVLAGHYDTVPEQDNLPGRIEDGAVIGLGASDMKGGLAVLLELARELDADGVEPSVDLALLLFGKEELPAAESPLPALFDGSQLVHDAALAILLEPTDVTIQAGCLGNLNALVHFHGVSGHSARPWTAENAIDNALEGLRPFAGVEPRPVQVGGLTFTEVVSITRIEGGIASNVIPDRVTANVNFRYAPDRSSASAEAYLRSLLPPRASFEPAGDSPPARVVTDSPLVHRLQAAGGLALEPKQAWTNVADFTSRGIDAVNFGPGATRYAHRRDERVEIAALERAYAALRAFVTGTV